MSKVYFEDRNYPFDIYVVPAELKKLFKNYMRGEGAALVEYIIELKRDGQRLAGQQAL